MNDDRQELIGHRLDRARQEIEAARLMLREQYLHACVNRLYYGCFHAVSALLLSKGLSPSKHTHAQALFNKHWVKTGLVPKDAGRFYSALFDARLAADYADMAEFAEEEVCSWLEEAMRFVSIIEQFVQPDSGKTG